EYDITAQVRDGANAIALDVFRNNSRSFGGFLTLNMVDWNPVPADNWTGLQFAPQLEQVGAVSLLDAHVVQQNAADFSASTVTVKARLRNNAASPVQAALNGSIEGNGTDIRFVSRSMTVAAGPTQPVSATFRIDPPAV